MKEDNKHIDIALLTRFMAGHATQEEQEFVTHWKEASAENQQQYTEFEKVWKAMDKTTPKNRIDIDAEWKLHLSKYNPSVGKSSKSISMRTIVSTAASILLVLGLSYFGWLYLSQKSIKTTLTETSQITLPDGSKVTINAGSKLTYTSFGNNSRRVTLEGEGYFEVTKNPNSPFIITVDDVEVKVLGTTFNVKAYKNMPKIEVTVAEGKVRLYEKGQEQKNIVIEKGETGTYDKIQKEILKKPQENHNFIAWKTHTLVFENDSMTDIAQILCNVYHKEIILTNANLEHCTVTTSFDNKDLETILKVLSETLDIVVEERDGKIYISGKGC